jgi:hypothetical protein
MYKQDQIAIEKQKDLAIVIRLATAIACDESLLTNRYCLKALD